jgi:hypothetical protein
MTPRPRHPERGVTLTELTIATVLASVIMFGLVGFYMGSQGVWMDSSGQALTQREATQIIETLSKRGGAALGWTLTDVVGTDSLQSVTFLVPRPGGFVGSEHFWWDANDHRIHLQTDGGPDQGALNASEVQKFAFHCDEDTSYVEFALRMQSPENHIVAITSGMALPNNPRP